jgi:glycosyltransferase involved in cell wall biosynthesis
VIFTPGSARARVFVYDNGSTDETVALAREAGAEVRHEPLRGKGNVVRRMFADVEADVYVWWTGTTHTMRAPHRAWWTG